MIKTVSAVLGGVSDTRHYKGYGNLLTKSSTSKVGILQRDDDFEDIMQHTAG